jgi:hypothetical protein
VALASGRHVQPSTCIAIKYLTLWSGFGRERVSLSAGYGKHRGQGAAGTGRCWTGFCIFGLTLDELADVARANARHKVTVLRDFSEEEFRQHLRHSNDTGRRYIVNFSRERIFGAGVGHFSPVGGYLEAEDLVFILDVNSEYQPWLVASKRLFDAVNTFDGNRKRGFLLIE